VFIAHRRRQLLDYVAPRKSVSVGEPHDAPRISMVRMAPISAASTVVTDTDAPEAGAPALVAAAVATLDLIGSLGSFSRADRSRIALIGHSQGGEVAMLVMVVDPHVRAVALFAPDSSDMADNARRWWGDNPAEAGALGTPDQNPVGYAHISPRRYFRRGGPPVLLVQGTADEEIPAAWTTATYDALRRAGVRTRLVWIPGAPHIMTGSDLTTEVATAEAWLRQALR